jgi:hypothetical protein
MLIGDYLYREKSCGRIDILNKIIQIDGSKFGKRKYNRARYVDGHWVIRMIENNFEDFPVVEYPGNFRDTGALIPIIKKQV